MDGTLASTFTAIAASVSTCAAAVGIVYCIEKISARRSALKKDMN